MLYDTSDPRGVERGRGLSTDTPKRVTRFTACCSGPSQYSNSTFPLYLSLDEALRSEFWSFVNIFKNDPHRRCEGSLQLGYLPLQRPAHLSRLLAALCSSCSTRCSSSTVSIAFRWVSITLLSACASDGVIWPVVAALAISIS